MLKKKNLMPVSLRSSSTSMHVQGLEISKRNSPRNVLFIIPMKIWPSGKVFEKSQFAHAAQRLASV